MATVSAALILATLTSTLRAQDNSPTTSADRPSAPLLPAGKIIFDAEVSRANQGANGFGPPPSFPLPSCGFSQGLCGAVNRDGTLAVSPKFDWVDSFHEGRALVRSNGRYGYVDTSGRVIAKPQYAIADRFSHGFAQIDIGGRSGLIDLDGKTVLEPKFGYIIPFTENVFLVTEGRTTSEGIAGTERFREGIFEIVGDASTRTVGAVGRWGLVDRSGAWLVPPSLDATLPYDTEGTALRLARTDSGWGVIRPDGSWEIGPKFQQLGVFVDGTATAKIDDHWGFIDSSGRFKIEPKYDGLQNFAAGASMTVARIGKLYGLIDRSGAWVVQPQYEAIWGGAIPKSRWIVTSEKKRGVLDENAQLVIAPTFDYIPRFCSDGRIIGSIDDKPHIFSANGKPIEPPQGKLQAPVSCDMPNVLRTGDESIYVASDFTPITAQRFDRTGGFFASLAVANVGGKIGLLKSDGSWAVQPSFDAISPGSPDGPVLARIGARNGIIDPSNGAWITGQHFERICHIASGMAMAFEGGRRGVLDAHGSWLIQPRDGRIGIRMGDGLVPAQSGEHWGFVDAEGQTAIEARFDAPTFFDRGINWASTGGSWCPIDRRGQPIEGLQCQPSDPLKREFGVFSCQLGR
ncbi:WG repeat-containing protein [Bradyrhizobium genosp. A]|uniref:WG repeat-containing protein n=1 Tax=Bradyrhizobium genosp. A TaxID=83626 RepID=UPI003CECD010